jgi:hypothetical protein
VRCRACSCRRRRPGLSASWLGLTAVARLSGLVGAQAAGLYLLMPYYLRYPAELRKSHHYA